MSLPTPRPSTDSNGFSIAAIVLALLGFMFSPLLLGIPGVASAVIAARRGEPLAGRAVIIAGSALIVGIILGIIIRIVQAG